MAKFTRLGVVMSRKDGKGTFVSLGSRSKNEKYKLDVEVTVKDSSGKIVAQATNPILNVQNPRTNPNLTEEQIARIPDSIKNELVLVTDTDK